jgi:hypothetical protein
MILNDLRFDFHGRFENQISNQIPIFQYDFKNLKIVPKWFKLRFCKIVNQILQYSGDCFMSWGTECSKGKIISCKHLHKIVFGVFMILFGCFAGDLRFFCSACTILAERATYHADSALGNAVSGTLPIFGLIRLPHLAISLHSLYVRGYTEGKLETRPVQKKNRSC